MANPGPYPQMPPGPPMGGPPMGGPPVGATSMPYQTRPVRQGTSRAVPVVVSAGLAVGVFCGLLFGLGTDKDEASASTTASNGVKSTNDDSAGTAPTTPDKPKTDTPKTDKPSEKPATGSGAVAANGSATPANGSATPPAGSGASAGSAQPAAGSATPAAGSGATNGSATVPPPAKSVAKLILDIKPDPGPQAKITVDGKDVTGTTFDVDLGTDKSKTVKVAITAPGFHSYEQKIEVKGETTVNVELAKRAATYVRPPPGTGSATPPVKQNGKDGKGGKKGGGGVIDL
jgi:hypothetical protein